MFILFEKTNIKIVRNFTFDSLTLKFLTSFNCILCILKEKGTVLSIIQDIYLFPEPLLKTFFLVVSG